MKMAGNSLAAIGIALFVYLSIIASTHAIDGDVVVAYIDMSGINGSFKFTQHNTSHVGVAVKLSYDGPDDKVYKIHRHPTSYQAKCMDVGETILNLNESVGNSKDVYVIVPISVISLKGPTSILGQSIVVTNSSSAVLACAAILSEGKDTSYASVGISNKMIAGKFEFIQQGSGDTVVTGQVSHSDDTTVGTTGYQWYVLETKLPSVQMVPQCPSNFTDADIFNPQNKNGSQCSGTQQGNCPIGDLSGKHGNLSVGIHGNQRITKVDTNLPIHWNDVSVHNRLLVITKNGPGESRQVLGCGIIKQRGPLKAISQFTADVNKGIEGHLSFQQDSPYHQTKVQVILTGLAERVKGYHVHQYPISDVDGDRCGGASVGGHMNPWKVVQKYSPPPKSGTMEKYECGDISGKFGNLANCTGYQLDVMDPNLPIFGHYSMMGRSVVIHRNDATNSRFTCADVVPEGGVKIKAHTNFTAQSPLLDGYVTLTQYEYPNGIWTPTMYLLDLKYKSNSSLTTKYHNFHVHVRPLGNDTLAGGTCLSVAAHYNPSSVVAGSDVYKKQCDANHPYRCEVGDTSAKVGTYNIGDGKRLFCDEDSPLFGRHSVLGRSVVFHTENKGSPRLACADIVPLQGMMSKRYHLEGKKSINDTQRMASMVDILKKKFSWNRSDEWKVSYPRLEDNSKDDSCYSFSFFLLGKNQLMFKEKIDEVAKEKESTYEPCGQEKSSSNTIQAPIALSLLSLLLASCLLR